jgi:poly(hydroxyalkanoate) granule-associated protein
MVRKTTKTASGPTASSTGPASHLLDGEFANAVKDSAQQSWQAGLGAFAKAQGEGSKVYESLVKEGLTIQRKTQAVAEEKLVEVTDRMTRLSDGVQSRAGQQWDKLESIFEARVAKAMHKLGVPLSSDVDALNARIDALSAQLARLSKVSATGKAVVRKNAAAKRGTTIKPSAPRKRAI